MTAPSEVPALYAEIERLRAERNALLAALRDLFAPPTGSPAADRVDHAAAWHRARAVLSQVRS